MRNPIQTIISSSTESASAGLFLTSDSDRYINVFDPQNQKLVLNLIAENEVSSLSYAGASTDAPLEKQLLAAVTDDGTVELFMKPFVQSNNTQTTSLKARGKQMTRRADASIKITRSESSEALVAVVTASIQGPDVVVAYAEGGIIPVFERVRWLDEETGELSISGVKNVTKTKSSNSVLGSVSTNKTKNAGETQVDESRAVVEQGNMADGDVEMEDTKQDAASASDSDEEDEDDSDDEDRETKKSDAKTDSRKKKEAAAAADHDVEMQEPGAAQGGDQDEDEDEEEAGEPSFGELLRANASEEVDVEAELDEETGMGALIPGKPNAAVHQVPSGVSLSTVLTQALKTNDSGMLESCFHTGDLAIIRTTIQRLDSSLAATLLQRLAERLSSRPGRYGHLLVWVQWTCVAHGGALAGKPELLKRMTTLFKVMDQRSSSLSSLLLLKGKLDMLDSQLALRQALRGNAEGMESEDEDNVIYVEGQEDDEDDEDSDSEAKNPVTPRTKSIRDQAFQDEDEAMANGVQSGMDESDNDEGSDDEEVDNEDDNVLDVEAEESAGSSDAEESPDEDEDEDEDSAASEGSIADFIADSEDEGESDIEMPSQPPSKKAKMQGAGGAKGTKKKGSSGRK